MRPVRASIALIVPLVFGGCGYVHFGRRSVDAISGGAAAEAYSSLATEHKILKRELELVRKEGDTLRIALERAGGIPGAADKSSELANRLDATLRELASLRADYSKLQAERTAASASAASSAAAPSKAAFAEQLAGSLRNSTQLQEENARLRTDVTRTQAENAALADQLKAAALEIERSQASLTQLNTELLGQKEARVRAEQAADAVRTQLSTVLAHQAGPAAPADPREKPVSSGSLLQSAKAPPADSSPSAEFRVSTEQLRTANSVPVIKPGRVHIVQAGDTLEKIALQYFKVADRWRAIYDANSARLGRGQPLQVGMELQIPDTPQKPD